MLTFSHIAKKANISRSGINCHFKKKEELIAEIRPILEDRVKQALDFDSPTAFYKSWQIALASDRMFRNLVKSLGAIQSSTNGENDLVGLIKGDPKEVQQMVYMIIGYTTIHINDYD